MTDGHRALLERWLESGDETQKRHARNVLGGNVLPPRTPGQFPSAQVGPAAADVLRLLRLAQSCPYRTKEPGCCTGYLAWCYRARGGRVTEFDCIECQRELNPARPDGINPAP